MNIVCTCGTPFRTIKTGEMVIVKGVPTQRVIAPMDRMYSCDVKECAQCKKRILDAADTPVAVGDAINAEAERHESKGGVVYGG